MIKFFLINDLNGNNYPIKKTFLEIINSKKKVIIFIPNKNIKTILLRELNKKFTPNEKYSVHVESEIEKFLLLHNAKNYKVIFLYLNEARLKKINIEKFYNIESIIIVTGKLDALISGIDKNLYSIEFFEAIEHRKPEYEKYLYNYLNKWSNKSKLTNEEIEQWVVDAISIARERVYIQSPWFNNTFSKRFLYLLVNALSRGVQVKLFYGMGDDARYEKTIETIALIEVELTDLGNFEAVEVNSHSAEIIIDSYNLTSSQNIGSSTFGEWGETGTLRKCNSKELKEAINAMYVMQKNKEGEYEV